jgi:hypothetical protein
MLNRPLSRDNHLDVLVDLQADETRHTVRGPMAAQPACTHWNIEVASLSLQAES